MVSKSNLPSFAAGVATATMAMALFASVSAQPKKEVIEACANAGDTMKLAIPSVPCEPGERRILLKAPDLEDEKKEPEQEERGLMDLDRRLKNLEDRNASGRLLKKKVVAPFEVVNDADRRVFYVEEGQVSLYNEAGKKVARIIANENGGYFHGISATSPVSAAIGSSGQQVGVMITESDHTRISMGRNADGNYGLRVMNASDKIVAGIGQSNVGSGIATVSDAEGNPRALMYVLPGSSAGMIEVKNGKGVGVATLSASGFGGSGLMQVTNAEGTVMVEAGVLKTGIGVVRAGPAGFNSGIGFLGLPGSLIQGRAAQ